MRNNGRRNFVPRVRGLSLGAALLLSNVQAAGTPTGDFAPLAVGNTWVYKITEEGSGFWWNPIVGHRVHRTLLVESRAEAPGGVSLYVLSYRDSLFLRSRTPDSGSGTATKLPDTVRTGRFQVAESAGDGRLSLHPLGHPIPPGMEVYFRRRFRSGEVAAGTGAGDSLNVVVVSGAYNTNVVDSVVYARDMGVLHFRRQHHWWEGPHHPGRMISKCVLESFNGRPIAATGSLGAVPPGSVAEGFSGLKTGRSWRYRGLRQRVPGESMLEGNHLRRDSVVRDLAVIGVTDSGGHAIFKLNVKDSLHHRSYDGQPLPDKVEKGTISVTQSPGKPLLAVSIFDWGSRELQEDIRILFNRQAFAEATLDMRDFGAGPVRTSEYRIGFSGLMEDTLVHAEGIGIVRRSKAVMGIIPRLSDRFDWRLVELDGKPFDAVPVTTRLLPAPRALQTRSPSPTWQKWWRPRNLLGRIQER